MRHQVIITPPAQENIKGSFLWGQRKWGKVRAQKWLRELRGAIRDLAKFPERCPLAPESSEFSEEVRQLVIDRYRVLFTIQGKKVFVLHVRGSYATERDKEEE